MDDGELEARLHRTWLALLLAGNYEEVAALVVDAELTILQGNHQPEGVSIDLPPSAYIYVSTDTSLKRTIEEMLTFLRAGYLLDQNGGRLETLYIEYRVKLLDLEQNWREVVKDLIVNARMLTKVRLRKRYSQEIRSRFTHTMR